MTTAVLLCRLSHHHINDNIDTSIILLLIIILSTKESHSLSTNRIFIKQLFVLQQIEGWYYILDESIGRQKHLRAILRERTSDHTSKNLLFQIVIFIFLKYIYDNYINSNLKYRLLLSSWRITQHKFVECCIIIFSVLVILCFILIYL